MGFAACGLGGLVEGGGFCVGWGAEVWERAVVEGRVKLEGGGGGGERFRETGF